MAGTYGFGAEVALPFDDVVARIRAALAAEGFGILSEIDIEAALRAKLGVEFGPYLILGACNPPLAHQALSEDRDIGLLLPCNIVVRAAAGGMTRVAILDPEAALALADRPGVAPIAAEAKQRLARALAAATSA